MSLERSVWLISAVIILAGCIAIIAILIGGGGDDHQPSLPVSDVRTEYPASDQQDSETSAVVKERTPLSYGVVQIQDVSYSRVVRLVYRIRVSRTATADELRQICNQVIEVAKRSRPHNAIAFFFYLPGTDVQGFCTAGRADWAPHGNWEQAKLAATGDYSRHRLAVNVGSAVDGSGWRYTVAKGIPEATRRRIFWDLTALQDTRPDDPDFSYQAYDIIAARYRVSKDSVYEIVGEGALKGWPMPQAGR